MVRKALSKKLREQVFFLHGKKCFYCGAEGIDLQIDHIHPVSLGGENSIKNLIPACEPCNRHKSDSDVHFYYYLLEKKVEELEKELKKIKKKKDAVWKLCLIELDEIDKWLKAREVKN